MTTPRSHGSLEAGPAPQRFAAGMLAAGVAVLLSAPRYSVQFAHIALFAIRPPKYRAFCNFPISRFLQFAHIALFPIRLYRACCNSPTQISRFLKFAYIAHFLQSAYPNIAFFAIGPFRAFCNSPKSRNYHRVCGCMFEWIPEMDGYIAHQGPRQHGYSARVANADVNPSRIAIVLFVFPEGSTTVSSMGVV
jgi:hypothetical protein